MSIGELARGAELSESAVYRIETKARARPQADTVAALALALGVTADELLGIEQPGGAMRESQTYAVGMEPVEEFVLVPFIGAASAGNGTLAEDNVEYLHRIDRTSLPQGHEDSCFITEARGDSMADVGISNGDQLLVCRTLPVSDGDIAVLNVDGEVVVKRVYRRNRKLLLVSENHDYPPREVDEALLIGVVMWSRRMHKKA